VQASVLFLYSAADSNLEGQAEQAVNARVSRLRAVRRRLGERSAHQGREARSRNL